MALTAEASARIAQIRAKVLAGTHTLEELKEGIAILRQDRQVAAAGATKSRAAKAAAAAPVNTSNILADLKAKGANLLSTVQPGTGS